MIKWFANLWKDFLVAIDELDKAGFTLPLNGYPFELYVNPELMTKKLPADSENASEQK